MYVFSDKKLGERITIITLISIYTIFFVSNVLFPPFTSVLGCYYYYQTYLSLLFVKRNLASEEKNQKKVGLKGIERKLKHLRRLRQLNQYLIKNWLFWTLGSAKLFSRVQESKQEPLNE